MMLIFSSFHFSTSRQSLACLIWGFPGLTVKEKEKGTDVTLCHPLTCNTKTHVYITGAVAGGGLAIILTFSSRVSLRKGTILVWKNALVHTNCRRWDPGASGARALVAPAKGRVAECKEKENVRENRKEELWGPTQRRTPTSGAVDRESEPRSDGWWLHVNLVGGAGCAPLCVLNSLMSLPTSSTSHL